MAGFDDDELTDQELDRLLAAWKTPIPTASMRAATFRKPAPLWRRMWTASIRIPIPLAAALILLAALGWWWAMRVPHVPAASRRVNGRMLLQPVAELRPRIIRGRNAEN